MRQLLTKISFSFYTTLFIFILYVLIFTITACLIYTVIGLGWFDEESLNPMLLTLAACFLVGTTISIIWGHKMLKNVRIFTGAMDQLASGDFSVRLNMTHPLEYQLLSDNFNRMAEQLAGIQVLRTDFINHFSHEFKTPIVSIKGFAQILKDDTLSKEEREEYLTIMIEEADRLSTLATNVLMLSNIESQTLLVDRQRFNLGEQLRQCILMFEPKLIKKDILLLATIEDEDIYANKELLNQVWLNLLDNAIKFVPIGGKIEVSMGSYEADLTVMIADNGCGIAKETLPKIFDKFYQEDHSRKTMGNGLGLSIVKKIILLHQGEITCDSIPNQRTIFTIRLPKSL